MSNSNPKQTKAFRDSQGRFARVDRELARKAGQKGAASFHQREAEKRTMKETLVSLLDVQLEPDKVRQRIINLGYPPQIAENVTPRLMIARTSLPLRLISVICNSQSCHRKDLEVLKIS